MLKNGVIVVSLQSEETFNNLVGQDFYLTPCLYRIQKNKLKLFQQLVIFLLLKKRQSVLDALSDERIEIVSLTITEKGYHYNSDKKQLDLENQNIIEDLGSPKDPETVVGFIVAGFEIVMLWVKLRLIFKAQLQIMEPLFKKEF